MAVPLRTYPGRPDTPPETPPVGDRAAYQQSIKDLQDKALTDAKNAQLAAEARADAKQKARDLKTGKRYAQGAKDLRFQIRSLKDAIKREFARSRRQNIGDLDMMLSQQLDQLKEGAAKRGEQFLTAAADTEKATSDAQESGIRNLVRERADTLSGILEQGAGETDAVRAMLMNARNFNANQSETSRSYFDTMQSINSGINDLNVDTETGLKNAHMQTQGQKELVWQDFYNRKAEALQQLGNTQGKRVEYLEQAKELGVEGTGKKLKKARKGMKNSFAAASNVLGRSYDQEELPDWIENWEGTEQQPRRQENTNLAAAPIMEGVQRAQGATLRTWA